MKKKTVVASALFFALILFARMTAFAAVPTVTQTVTLNPGWNAVYLEVQPLSNEPAMVFRGLPAGSSVWVWTGKNDVVAQFIQDPGEAPVNRPNWLAIFTSSAESALNNLYAITANSAYLISTPTGTGSGPVTLNIAGRPTIRHKGWVPDSFNLTGFSFAATPPTFSAFFSPSPSHKNQTIYRLNNTTGAWTIVNNPSTTAMRSGEAFWVYCQSGSDYQGPLSAAADGADGLDFGAGITTMQLTLNNAATSDKTVSVVQLSADYPVALVYRSYDAVSGHILTNPLTGMPPVLVKAGSSSVITLAVNRKNFSGPGASVLELTDTQGDRIRVPVTATSNALTSYPGLWSGAVTLNKVSQLADSAPTAPYAPGEAKTTPAALNLNLILHQDRNGQVRLLKQAIVMYQDGAASSGGKGRYVVLTRDSLIPNYSGVTQRDGSKVGRRLSAIGFDYSPGTVAAYTSPFGTDFDGTALHCSGSISATVSCQLVLESSAASTQPTNPFLHRYHPDHDNLDSDYKTFKQEVNRIQRDITFEFDSTPRDNPDNPPPGWGVTVLGGTYTESISGLAKGPILTQGNFTLNLATDVDLLNE